MRRFKVSFELLLDDDSSHPRKWVPDMIWDALRTGEDVYNYAFEEVEDEEDEE